jgi:hypothetical protein
MVGAILGAASDNLLTASMWLIGLSPLATPLFASQSLLPTMDLPLATARAIPPAFWFWQGVSALATAALVHTLWRRKKNT